MKIFFTKGMLCISFRAQQYKQPASADGEFMNKLTWELCALVRVFLERL